ncbi:MAG: GreA/GreB family elongation factor, partial [Phyllobacterium sp.]|nr:GreA/GreB family elongation factor [Phyllobacterium sp.]
DASHGKISHVSPMAQLMFGKSLGDIFELNGREWEIIAIGLPQVESE